MEREKYSPEALGAHTRSNRETRERGWREGFSATIARATRTRGGVFTALYWFGVGCLFCIAIVGIPLGRQAFKMAKLSLLPFGATVR
ncbi:MULTISPECIES: YccF domain-containing protein [unclassified Collinsella]|uniref:YccF domain-containing protein n=1 Tax=unclassified Collinsella TaxID=2637548 RepID=UPI002942FBAE|nr:YccF domain-containing protein [uncultured Collinsella sp.]